VEEALPVTMLAIDDQVEAPESVIPRVVVADHPIVAGLAVEWPGLLGFNRIIAKPGATVIATAGDDPLLVAGSHGAGRTVAFASDRGPHWAPPAFREWDGYARLWLGIIGWAAAAG